MAFQRPFLISLRRQDERTPWGFRMVGGTDLQPQHIVQQVLESSQAENAGLHEGDEVIQVGRVNVQSFNHREVQEVVAQCRNRMEMFVIREDLLRSRKENEPPVVKAVVHSPYNSPFSLYSTENVADTLALQTTVLTEHPDSTSKLLNHLGPASPPVIPQSDVLKILKEEESGKIGLYNGTGHPLETARKKPAPPTPPPKPSVRFQEPLLTAIDIKDYANISDDKYQQHQYQLQQQRYQTQRESYRESQQPRSYKSDNQDPVSYQQAKHIREEDYQKTWGEPKSAQNQFQGQTQQQATRVPLQAKENYASSYNQEQRATTAQYQQIQPQTRPGFQSQNSFTSQQTISIQPKTQQQQIQQEQQYHQQYQYQTQQRVVTQQEHRVVTQQDLQQDQHQIRQQQLQQEQIRQHEYQRQLSIQEQERKQQELQRQQEYQRQLQIQEQQRQQLQQQDQQRQEQLRQQQFQREQARQEQLRQQQFQQEQAKQEQLRKQQFQQEQARQEQLRQQQFQQEQARQEQLRQQQFQQEQPRQEQLREEQLRQQEQARQEQIRQEQLRQQQIQQQERIRQEQLRQQQLQQQQPKRPTIQQQESQRKIPRVLTNPDYAAHVGSMTKTGDRVPLSSTSRMTPDTPTMGSPNVTRRGGGIPVWPPKNSSVRDHPRTGFSPNLTHEKGSKKFTWPPPKEEGEHARPPSPTGGFQNAWHPEESSSHRSLPFVTSPPPNRRNKDIVWPPPHTAQRESPKHSPKVIRRKTGSFDDYIYQHASVNVPPTYRTPPGTQHVEIVYEDDF